MDRRKFMQSAGLFLGAALIKPPLIHSLERITAPEQWRKPKELDGLYLKLAQDIKENKPIIFTTYLGLWSEGKSPEDNLYWGKLYGHHEMFNRAKRDFHIRKNFKNHNWEKVHSEESKEDPLRTVVYDLRVKPNNFWKSLGIKNDFKIKQIYLVYEDIRKAGMDLTLHLKQDQAKIIETSSGKIDLGNESRIMGYNGHNYYYDGDFPGPHNVEKTSEKTKAIYCLSCKSRDFFGDVWTGENIYGLLFTTSFMAPEGYNLLSLIDSIAQGQSGKKIINQSNEIYKYFQQLGGQKTPGNLFVNHSKGLF